METEKIKARALSLYLSLNVQTDDTGMPVSRRGTPIYALADGAPEWMRDACYACHDGILPDDWRYAFINEAAGALGEADELEDVFLEPDVYHEQLLQWLASRLSRSWYCDDALNDYGLDPSSDLMTRIGYGQAAEKNEVLGLLVSALADLD